MTRRSPRDETIASAAASASLDDMRAFAAVASAASFTVAARSLGMPKQTLSRRIAALEAALGVPLLHRTTRRLHLTAAGAVYARRCAELARLAAEANKDAQDALATPRGTLRITADPVLGEAFVNDLVVAYARAWPEMRVDLVLTRRRVDVIEEGFDLAFRVGFVNDATLTGVRIGPASIKVCASPAYVKRHGRPRTPEDLAHHHECVIVGTGDDDSEPLARWPFRGPRGLHAPHMVTVHGRLRSDSVALAHKAVRAGLGVGLFPAFLVAADLKARRLVSLLDDHVVDAGAIWLLHAPRPPLRVQAFVQFGARAQMNSKWTRDGRAHP